MQGLRVFPSKPRRGGRASGLHEISLGLKECRQIVEVDRDFMVIGTEDTLK